MQQLLCALLLGLGLIVAHVPSAEAHGLRHAVVVYEGKVVRKFRPDLPRWLAHQRGFHRWYLHYGHHHLRHPDWHGLYRLYLRDTAWHRHDHKHKHKHKHRHRRGGH